MKLVIDTKGNAAIYQNDKFVRSIPNWPVPGAKGPIEVVKLSHAIESWEESLEDNIPFVPKVVPRYKDYKIMYAKRRYMGSFISKEAAQEALDGLIKNILKANNEKS